MPQVRHHFPDEEPDWDEDLEARASYEERELGSMVCVRCGVEGHEGNDCPTVVPHLLRNQWG